MLDVTTLTPQDFRDMFPRDFQYAPNWDVLVAYSIGEIVYYPTDKKVYRCTADTAPGDQPTDMLYWVIEATTITNYIIDADILKAFDEAQTTFNEKLAKSDKALRLTYLYLSAHYMVKDLRGGGKSSQANGLVSSRSVGSVSESFTVPKWQQGKVYGFYTDTYYGSKYLNMVMPNLIGNVLSIPGWTNP